MGKWANEQNVYPSPHHPITPSAHQPISPSAHHMVIAMDLNPDPSRVATCRPDVAKRDSLCRRFVASVAVPQLAILVIATLALSGCQSAALNLKDRFDLDKPIPWLSDEEGPEIPERIVCFWTDAVNYKQGEQPTRGFGGRVLFYGKDNSKTLRVKGQLVVYAFDEAGRTLTDNKPTRKFVFPPEQFERHLSDSDFGPSYSVWLPWDQVGGPRKDISLIARFEPIGGAVVLSRQVQHRLPGAMSEVPAMTQANPSAAGQNAAVTNAAANRVATAGYATTSTSTAGADIVQWAAGKDPSNSNSAAAMPAGHLGQPATGNAGGNTAQPPPVRRPTTTIPLPTGLQRRLGTPQAADLHSQRLMQRSGSTRRGVAHDALHQSSLSVRMAQLSAEQPSVDSQAPVGPRSTQVAYGPATPHAVRAPAPRDRSAPQRRQAPGEPIVQPARVRGPWIPFPAALPSVQSPRPTEIAASTPG